jgi:hypothetical protein
MKIFFSTLFDRETYPHNIFKQNGVAAGSIHLGVHGLMNFIGLHLGIPKPLSNSIKRIFDYRKNLHANSKESFYHQSLEANDLDVATTLLAWRDELKLAGWDFKLNRSASSRLRDIAALEKDGIAVGFPEAYLEIIKLLQQKIDIPLKHIVVHEPLHLLPPFIRKLFSLLENSGVTIEERKSDTIEGASSDLHNLRNVITGKEPKRKYDLQNDGSIQILNFGDMLSAAKGVAALMADDSSFKPIIINESKNPSLSLELHEKGMPSTGQALHAASHPDLQLLAIMPVWLWKPYNPQQVLDFLLCPLNILPVGLCFKLSKMFSEKPGIGLDDWREKFETYISKNENKKEVIKHTQRFNYLLNAATEASEKISTSKIRDYYSYFYNIFNSRCNATSDEHLIERLKRLCGAFRELIDILGMVQESLNRLELQQLLNFVLRPISIVPFEREAHSVHEISNPGLLCGQCNDLLWFGFTSRGGVHALWDVWTQDELEWLAKKNIQLETPQQKAQRHFWFITQWLRFVNNRLILILPSVVDGEASQPHPFQSVLDACFSNLHDVTIHVEHPSQMQLRGNNRIETKKVNINPIPAWPLYWQLKNGDLLNNRESAESFNSLSKLIHYPYQWVLKYKAMLTRGNAFYMPPLYLFYGNLSHAIFQKLLTMADILIVKDDELKKRYELLVGEMTITQGLLLHIPGQEGTLKFFKEYLFGRFITLLEIIKENHWTVEGCELEMQGKIGDELVLGRCDLLLQRKRKATIEKAIVDLKYANTNKYRDLMLGSEDLQLAIYSRLFHPEGNHCATSYFIIREGRLLTTCSDFFKGAIAINTEQKFSETYSHLLHRMSNTISFRRSELTKGKIEVGDNACIEDLDIFRNDSEEYLLPEIKGGNKVYSEYNEYMTFIDSE